VSNNKQDYEEVWNTVSETTELDIFKAYGVLEEPEDKGETPEQDPKPDSIPTDTSPATSAIDQPEAASASGEVKKKLAKELVQTLGLATQPVISEEPASSAKPQMLSGDGGTDDPKSQSSTSVVDAAQGQESQMDASADDDGGGGPVITEAGLIDPETGEILEPSLILKKFGWTEYPKLGKMATVEELASFEEKLDQVADKILSHMERASRYRAAAELKCKPYDGAAAFWHEQFFVPMSKMLGPHKLQKTKTGKYKSKTMVLNSGCVKFTKGGGWSIYDSAMLKEHIKKTGLEAFKIIEAKEVVQYSHSKCISALNKGKLKDLPGTQHKAIDDFATVKLVAPGAADSKEEADNGDE